MDFSPILRSRAVNDEEYLDWIERHGGPPELRDFSIVRGLYDLAFGFVDGDPTRPSMSAGTAVLFGGKSLLDYKDSFIWKMAAGMGDIVFAPLYEALRRRGVDLRVLPPGRWVASLRGRQSDRGDHRRAPGRLAAGRRHYEPCTPTAGCRGFRPPRADQLVDAEGIEGHPLESHWCEWPDVERRVLRHGEDFDLVVFALPPGWPSSSAASSWPPGRSGATWWPGSAPSPLSRCSSGCGSPRHWVGAPGSTVSAIDAPFSTWASMSHLIDVEEWPAGDRPGSIAYFCGVLEAGPVDDAASAARWHGEVRRRAADFIDHDLGNLLPGAVGADGFRWDLLCGSGRGSDPLDSQYWRANIDPSDRYVQSLPGTDRYRLRSDESGYDNLFLAGDWTDSGINAGCIEAAVLSGLQAANAVGNGPGTTGSAATSCPEHLPVRPR